jgi:hypothetical protein
MHFYLLQIARIRDILAALNQARTARAADWASLPSHQREGLERAMRESESLI